MVDLVRCTYFRLLFPYFCPVASGHISLDDKSFQLQLRYSQDRNFSFKLTIAVYAWEYTASYRQAVVLKGHQL